jgi:hypothetical protein
MALIGTISGSNGTSTTAISGSLIIADEPLSRFPALASGVKLFVSGNKTPLGSDTPNSIFGGDTFVSGAFGTDSYIQMKPVGTLAIPTNTTASYIYTSGSTNDLYFTQYQPGTGYTNTTRLRWLEGNLSTGLLHGGVLSTENGTTTFSITSGSGLIIDYNASTVDEPYPTIVQVDWPAYVSSSLPNISTAEITYIAIDSTGALVKQNTAYIDGDFEDKIVIGRVLHQNGSVTNGTITSPTVAYGQTGFRGDFIRAFGPLKLGGHVVSVNATATNPPTNTQFLGLAKTAGDSYVEGRNYTTNPNSPNYIKSTTDTALTTSKIYREYVNSSGVPVIDTGVANAGYTAVDVTNYNNAGTLTPIGSGNKYTIQRLYWFPNSVNRAIFAYYGNAIYTTIDEAEAAIGSEAFTEGDNTRDAAILLGYLIVKEGATDLNNATQAKLIQAGLSRAIASTGGGGSATTPGGSDTYVQYNDGGSFNGTNDFRFIEGTGTVLAANLFVTGTAAGSLVSSGTFQVKGGSGNIVGSISTGGIISGSSDLQIGGNITGSNLLINGDITGSNLRLTGDIAVLGGDLTTTAATFNLATNLGTQLNVGGTTPTISIGTSTGASTVGIATGTNTLAAVIKNVNIGTGTASTSTVLVNIGSSGSLGRTTLNNDVFLTTGNIVGSPGSGGVNMMSLISSGNIIARLDTDNSAPGHKFAVQNYNSADQFSVTETGDAEIANTLFVTGSITTSGSLRSINSSGDEGGEIFLSKSVTSTTLTGGVTIDVWQNRLRMFEQGGSARGYYLDITKGGDSVTSDLFRGDPMFAFLNRRMLIAQVEDSVASGFFGMFPFDIATSVSNTSSVLGNSDATMGFTSPATANTAAAWRTTNTWARIGHTGRMRVRLTTGLDITSQTITFGLGTGTSTSSAGNSFSFSPAESQILAVYNAGTANWLLLTKDGTTANTVDTGVAVASNTEYFIEIIFTASTVTLSVNGSTPVSSSTNLPAAGTSLYPRAGINPTTNAIRGMFISRMVFEAGQVTSY